MHARSIPLWLGLVALTAGPACRRRPEAPVVTSDETETRENPKTAKVEPGQAKPNAFWWPERLDLTTLRDSSSSATPHDDFDYAQAFSKIDYAGLKKDIEHVLTDSQEWWPADYGTYGPLFIRMAWHSAGTYRVRDGRGGAAGGQQRFEPLNSWPDNVSLDKARRLLWPVKKKYGRSISWSDLMILAGNVAMESMGFETLGFSGGRADDWEADLVYWGPESEMMASRPRFHGGKDVENPLAATTMGLIYVNPEGPNGTPDPAASAERIRLSFGLMAMNDEETVALIAGGHTFGKAHGAHSPKDCVGEEPAAADVTQQGFGWANKCGKGSAEDTVTSGLEGAWTTTPNRWSHSYLANLFNFVWKKTSSPAGAHQWMPEDEGAKNLVPDAHDPEKRHAPMMFTTDLALKTDDAYAKIAKRFMENPEQFEEAFAKAWFKLTHRDMGPRARYVGPEVPEEDFIWQDPVPAVDHRLIDGRDARRLKAAILDSGLTVSQLVRTAWASASTFRDTDMRGGANGARIRLAPQKDWPVNDPSELSEVIAKLDAVRERFNGQLRGGKKVSLADTLVLAGAAAIEKAASDAGVKTEVPFAPGRTDATQEQTDVKSFGYLEPEADAFRNYYAEGARLSPSEAMVDKADILGLTAPEMTALIGGMRVLGANAGGSKLGVLTEAPGKLSNDFFVNLLDMSTKWSPAEGKKNVFVGKDRDTGEDRWTATEVDLVFGSNSELRAVAEVYAFEGGQQKLVKDFVAAWTKVMQNDRFDLEKRS